jgi:hypothetical protein
MLSQGAPSVLVAEVENEIVGFIALERSRDADSTPQMGEISAIYVVPSS